MRRKLTRKEKEIRDRLNDMLNGIIEDEREAQGLSVKELVKLMKIHQSSYGHKDKAGFSFYAKAAAVLDLNIYITAWRNNG